MALRFPCVVANTDRRWFDFFRREDTLTVVDEVNFWRPSAQSQFQALRPGEPFFLRLKSPANAIAGFGFFAAEWSMSIQMAWEVFGDKNGDPDRGRFEARIRQYRDRFASAYADHLSCLVLRDTTFLPEVAWAPWGRDMGWAPNLVTYKGYDLSDGPGVTLRTLVESVHPEPVPDFSPSFSLLTADRRSREMGELVKREGQGAFKVRLLRAYGGRCAVTGERSVPVLDAAHIQPYLGPASNHVQNGLVLRADLHRLYDAGYVTVTSDARLAVSSRLRDEFENGRDYYAMEGRAILLPRRTEDHPSREALEWHASYVFS